MTGLPASCLAQHLVSRAVSSPQELLRPGTVTDRKGSVAVLRAGPVVVIKCAAPRTPYSGHKLTYGNEAVCFAYSYITTNSQTRVNKLFCSAWCRVTSRRMAPGWGRPSSSFLSCGSRQGSCRR